MIFLYLGRIYMVIVEKIEGEVKGQNGNKLEGKIGQMFKVSTKNKKNRKYIVESIT